MKNLDKHNLLMSRAGGVQSRERLSWCLSIPRAPHHPALGMEPEQLAQFSLTSHLQLKITFWGLWWSLWTNNCPGLLYPFISTPSKKKKKISLLSLPKHKPSLMRHLFHRNLCTLCNHTKRVCKLTETTPEYCYSAFDLLLFFLNLSEFFSCCCL